MMKRKMLTIFTVLCLMLFCAVSVSAAALGGATGDLIAPTGDNSLIVPFILLLLLSAAGIVVLIVAKKRSGKK